MSKEYAYKYNNGVLVFGYEDNAYKPYKYYELRRKFERLYGKQELPEIEIYTTTPYIDLETHEVIKTIGYHEKYKLLMMQDFSDLNLEPYENLEEVKQAIDFLNSFIDFVYPTNQEAQNELLAHLICSCSGASLFRRPPIIVSRDCSPHFCDIDVAHAVGGALYGVHTGEIPIIFFYRGGRLFIELKHALTDHKIAFLITSENVRGAIRFLSSCIYRDIYYVNFGRRARISKRQNKSLIVLTAPDYVSIRNPGRCFTHFQIKQVNEEKIKNYEYFYIDEEEVNYIDYIRYILKQRKKIIEAGVRLVLWWLKDKDSYKVNLPYDSNNEHLYLVRDVLCLSNRPFGTSKNLI